MVSVVSLLPISFMLTTRSCQKAEFPIHLLKPVFLIKRDSVCSPLKYSKDFCDPAIDVCAKINPRKSVESFT